MLTIRRKVTFHQGYTVLMLPGDYKEIPTNEREHAEILKLYKQDKPYPDIINDFTEYGIYKKISKQEL